jgi:hypothetical protein
MIKLKIWRARKLNGLNMLPPPPPPKKKTDVLMALRNTSGA